MKRKRASARHSPRATAQHRSTTAQGHTDPMSGQHAVAADRVFDGMIVRADAAVVIDGAHIVDIVPRAALDRTMPVRVLPGGPWLAPGFIALQGNGGGG